MIGSGEEATREVAAGGAVARGSGGGAGGGVPVGAHGTGGGARRSRGSGTCNNSGRGRSSKDRAEAGGGDPGRMLGQPDERSGDDKESHDPAAGPGASRLVAREQALLWDGSDSGATWGGSGNRGGGGPARGGTGGCYWDAAGHRGAADEVARGLKSGADSESAT